MAPSRKVKGLLKMGHSPQASQNIVKDEPVKTESVDLSDDCDSPATMKRVASSTQVTRPAKSLRISENAAPNASMDDATLKMLSGATVNLTVTGAFDPATRGRIPYGGNPSYGIPKALLKAKAPGIFTSDYVRYLGSDNYHVDEVTQRNFELFLQWLYVGALSIPSFTGSDPTTQEAETHYRAWQAIGCYMLGLNINCSAFKNAAMKALSSILPAGQAFISLGAKCATTIDPKFLNNEIDKSRFFAKVKRTSGLWKFLVAREAEAMANCDANEGEVRFLKDVSDAHTRLKARRGVTVDKYLDEDEQESENECVV